MRLLSVNVGMPAKHLTDGKEVTTGIFKSPVPGRNRVRGLEIAAGDEVRLVDREKRPITVAQCIAATLLNQPLPDVLMELDRLPHLSQRWRAQVAGRLSHILAQA